MTLDHPTYCIIHTGRCGSTVLGRVLDRHPLVNHFGEIFTPGVWISGKFKKTELFAKREQNKLCSGDFERFIDACVSAGMTRLRLRRIRNDEARRFGFELKLFQIDRLLRGGPEEALDRLEAIGTTPFFLLRSNALKRIISGRRARRTGVWHVRTDDDSARPGLDLASNRILLPLTDLVDGAYHPAKRRSLLGALEYDLEVRTRIMELANSRRIPVLTYEEIDRDLFAISDRVLRELGLTSAGRAKAPLQRTAPARIVDEVENWSAVRAQLRGTQFEWMLEECEGAARQAPKP